MTDDSKMPEYIEGFHRLNRRECFADSADGLSAYVTFGQMHDMLESRAPSDAARGEALEALDDLCKMDRQTFFFNGTPIKCGKGETEFYRVSEVRRINPHLATIRAALHAPVPIKQDYADQRISEALEDLDRAAAELLKNPASVVTHKTAAAILNRASREIRAAEPIKHDQRISDGAREALCELGDSSTLPDQKRNSLETATRAALVAYRESLPSGNVAAKNAPSGGNVTEGEREAELLAVIADLVPYLDDENLAVACVFNKHQTIIDEAFKHASIISAAQERGK